MPRAMMPRAVAPRPVMPRAVRVFVRGLTLAHLDATLRGLGGAEQFLAGDVEAELAARGVGGGRAPAMTTAGRHEARHARQ
jgi:hypothetical protein